MTDRFDFDVALQFQSEGSEAQMAELGRYAAALEKAISVQEKFGKSTQNLRQRSIEVARAVSDLSKNFTKGAGDLASASQGYENITSQLTEMASAYRVAKEEAARAQSTRFSPAYGSEMPANVGAWETRELKEYLDLVKAASANLTSDVQAEFNRRKEAVEGAAQAQKRYNDVVSEGERSSRFDDMDRRTAAAVRLSEATQELAQAQARIRSEEAASAYGTASAEAYDRGREAITQYNAAAKESAIVVEEQAVAYEKQNEALDNLDFDKSITGMDKMDAATTKLARAQEELDAALEQVREEERKGGGAGTATAEAYDQVSAAAKRRSGAEKELTGVLQSRQAAELNMRYGLYDVSRSMALVSGAIVGVGAASVSAFAEWESGMSLMYQTNMDKPTSEVDRLGQVVRDLAGDIPIAVSELQGLIALAGQLDVQGDLGEFAEVMAQFGMISDTVDAEDAATRIAKLVNVLGGAESVAAGMGLSDVEDAYRAIATSIAEVGVNSAATDAEILHTASNMARVAAQANFTGDEVVGLASAFASMGMPAELSRSAFQDFVKVVNLGLAGVGEMPEKLDRMGQLLGVTREEIAGLWEADPAGFFLQLLAAVDAAADAGENVTGMLYEMGITSQRGAPAIAALAGNYDLVADSLGSAHKGMKEFDDENSTFAQRMEHIADDLASMWQILKNEFAETAAIVGEVIAPALKDLITFIGSALEGIQDFARSPFGGWVLDMSVKIGGFVAAIAGIVGAAFAARASLIAMSWAFRGMQVPVWISRMLGLSAATASVGSSARVAAGGVLTLGAALKIAGRATGLLLLLDFAIRLIFDFNQTVFEMLNAMAFVSNGLSNFAISASRSMSSLVAVASRAAEGFATVLVAGVNAAIDAINGLHSAVGSPLRIPKIDTGAVTAGIRRITSGVQGALADVSRIAQNNMDIWAQALRDWRKFSWGEGNKGGVGDFLGDPYDWQQFLEDLANFAYDAGEEYGNGVGDGAGKGAQKAKRELRLLTDYASDLAGVMSRAFDLRFGSMLSGDAISSAFIDMAEAAEESRKRVRDLQQSIRELRADMMSTAASISQHEYWLSVAVEYGDTLRAEELEAELAKLRAEQAKQTADLADKNKELAEAEDEASLSLTGNSKAAIEQRKTMTDLVKTYQSHLEMLAATGMSQEDLLKESQRLKKEFIDQAVGLGYNRKEVEKYAAAFDDMSLIIATVPRNVDIEFDGDPAMTALREFFAKLEDEIDGGIDVPVSASGLADLDTAFDNLFDSIGSRLGDLPSIGDAVFGAGGGDISTAGALAGKAVAAEVKKIGATLGAGLRTAGKKAGASYEDEMKKAGRDSGITFRDVFERIIKTVERILRGEGQKAGASFEGEMRKAGTEGGEGLRRNLHVGMLALAGQMPGLGQSAGLAYRGSFEGTASATGIGFGNKVVTGVSSARTRVQSLGTQAGNAYRGALETAGTSTLGSRMGNLASSALNTARSQIQSSGRSAGNSWNSGIRSSMNSGLTSSATTAGRNAANGFIAGMKAGLRGRSLGSILASGLGTKAGSTNVGNLYMANWWTGGYTGPGGKYTPAGIVHKGEYVVPKHGVDQRTGLPKADYMNSLGKPHSGSKASYASGGYVRGGNSGILGGGLTDADRRLIRSIANRPVKVEISSDAVARANNRANSRGAARGV